MDDIEEIQDALDQGFTEEEIREVLRQKGYSDSEISEMISEAGDSVSEMPNESKDGREGNNGGRRKGLLKSFQTYSSVVLLLASLCFYAGFETGFIPLGIFRNDLFLFGLAGAGLILFAQLGIGLYQLVARREIIGLVPVSITGVLLAGLIIFSNFMNHPLLNNLGGSVFFILVFVVANGAVLGLGLISSSYFYSSMKKYSLIFVFLPILVIAGSYGYTNLQVQKATSDLENRSFQHPALYNNFGKDLVVTSARAPPPANRLLLVGSITSYSRSSFTVLSGLSEAGREVATDPTAFCSIQGIEEEFTDNSESNNDAITSKMLKFLKITEQEMRENKEFFTKTMRKSCKRAPCPENIDYEAELESYIVQTKNRREAMETILNSRTGETPEADFVPMCSGEEKYRVKINDIKCDRTPEITLENQGDTIEKDEVSLDIESLGSEDPDLLLEPERIENWEKGEKHLEFKPRYADETLSGNKSYRVNIALRNSSLEFSAFCKPGEGFCSDCSPRR